MARPLVSLNPKDAIVGGGLFGPGKAKLVRARIGRYGYPGKDGKDTRKPVTAALITFTRAEEKHVEAYTVGDGFKPSKDGLTLVPIAGQNGLTDSCKFMRFLKSFQACGMPDDVFAQLGRDISGLEGLLLQLTRKTLPKWEGQRGGRSGNDPTILIVDEILKAPFKVVKQAADQEESEDDEKIEKEEEDEDEDEDEEDEGDDTPKAGKNEDEEDEDEDEEEETKKDADTSDEEPEDEDLAEAAGEKLIDALTDGALKKAKVQDAVTAEAKKDKATRAQAKAIGRYAAAEKFLKSEKGWSYDGRVVTAD